MSEDKTTIVTHNANFHSDDIFAVATLLLVLENNGQSVEVIRSRDENLHATAEYVVDVGSIHDPETNRFDHHQPGGAGKRDNGVQYAAFGLVWDKFGPVLCGSEELSEIIDREIVQPIDCLDNGLQFMEPKIAGLYPFDMRVLVQMFRPTWKEESTANIDDIFMTLVSYAKVIISREIKSRGDELEAEKYVKEAYHNAPDKRLIEIPEKYPWLKVLSEFPEPLYVIYSKKSGNETVWSLKAARDDMSKYEVRKPLPTSWGGKDHEELEKLSGVTGALYCHRNLWAAGAKTREAILQMAEIALNS